MDPFSFNQDPIDYEEVKYKERKLARDRWVMTLLIFNIVLLGYVVYEVFNWLSNT
jgi:hypothetical protein